MSLPKSLITGCLIASFGLVACNKTPKQYQAAPPPKFKRDLTQIPTREKLGDPTNPNGGISGGGTELPPDEKVRRVRENSRKDISYGPEGGGGGITFKTEYGQSKDILSKPFYGPDKDGLAAYEENIWVYWRQDKPRTPEAIFFNPGYLGSIDLGLKDANGKARLIHISDELSDLFVGDPSGKELVKKVFRHLEKVEDASFDCLAAGICQVNDSGKQFLQLSLPRAVLLFTQDDRRSLFRIVMVKAQDPGNFANDADLIQGKILIPGEQGQPADAIGVGMTWGEAKKKGEADADNRLTTRAFIKDFQGLGVIISKSRTQRDYFFPSDDEKLTGFYFTKDFQQQLLVNGEALKITKNLDGGVDLSRGCKPADQEPQGQPAIMAAREAGSVSEAAEILAEVDEAQKEKQRLADEVAKSKPSACFGTQVPLVKALAKMQKDLLRKLAVELIAQMSANGVAEEDQKRILSAKNGTIEKGDRHFLWAFQGFDADGTDRQFSMLITAFDHKASSGTQYSIQIDEKTGNVTVSLDQITNPLAAITVPASFQPIQAGSLQLGGFALGDKVKIKDIDLGREQATLVVERAGQSIETRVAYDPSSKMRLQYLDGDKLKEKDQSMESVGSENLGLGLHRVGAEGAGASEVVTLEVDALSVGLNGKGVENLCGIPGLKVSMNEKDTVFLNRLLLAVEKAKADSAAAKQKAERILKKKERIVQGSGEKLDPVQDVLTAEESAIMKFRGCTFDSPLDPNGSGLNVRYYFPEQRVLLSFDDTDDSGMDRELINVTIYKKANEKASELRGGAQ